MAKNKSVAAKNRDYIAKTPQRTKVPRVLIGLKGIKKDEIRPKIISLQKFEQ